MQGIRLLSLFLDSLRRCGVSIGLVGGNAMYIKPLRINIRDLEKYPNRFRVKPGMTGLKKQVYKGLGFAF